jgi:hypothetical protein
MTPVIRIDDDVWKKIQEKAKALVDTPNDVLRRMLKLDDDDPVEETNKGTRKSLDQNANGLKDTIYIIVNAAGERPDEANAIAGRDLTLQRVNSGIDLQAFRRFSRARKILKPGARIVMHQGGSHSWRTRYGAGQLRAAGTVKAVGLPLTDEDKLGTDYEISKRFYPLKALVGKAIYDFPKGMAKQPLPKEDVSYNPGRGDNFIQINPDDPRYLTLDKWWTANY